MSGSIEDRFGSSSRREEDLAEYLDRESAIEELYGEQSFARAVIDWDGSQFFGWLVADPDTMLHNRAMEQLRTELRAHAEMLTNCREVCVSAICTDVARQLQRDDQQWAAQTRFPRLAVPRETFTAHGLTAAELQNFLSHYQHQN